MVWVEDDSHDKDDDDEEPVEMRLTKKLLHQYDAAPLQPDVKSVRSEYQ